MNNKIRILVADDHAVLRSGLILVFKTDPLFEIIGEAENGEAAVNLARKMNPDVILMDINMPLMSGTEAARKIKEYNSEIKVIILTMHEGESYILDAVSCGIDGYLLKSAEMEEVLFAVKSVKTGNKYFPEIVSKALLTDYLKKSKDSPIINFDSLTKREKEIVTLIVRGFTSSEIAEKLYISYFTVGEHRKNIMKKLKLKNSAELVRLAIEYGLF